MQTLGCLGAASLFVASLQTASAKDGDNWVVSWTGPVQGPYPIGNPSSPSRNSPSLSQRQTFRLIVRPDLWGRQARIRLSNVFGTKPATFDGIYEPHRVSGDGPGHRPRSVQAGASESQR